MNMRSLRPSRFTNVASVRGRCASILALTFMAPISMGHVALVRHDTHAHIDSPWHSTQLPIPLADRDPGAHIYGVACSQLHRCVAIGRYQTDSSSERGMILDEGVKGWRALTAPVPSGMGESDVALNQVGCSRKADVP